MWDKVPVFIEFNGRQRTLKMGRKTRDRQKTYTNPMKEALQYRKLLDTGLAASQADIARILGVSRAKVTQMLNLLKLDEEIREFLLNLEETDGRLEKITERRLRSIIRLTADEQRKRLQRQIGMDHCALIDFDDYLISWEARREMGVSGYDPRATLWNKARMDMVDLCARREVWIRLCF